LLGASAALAATAAIVIFVVTRKPPPSAGLDPSPPPPPALTAESPPPADTERREAQAQKEAPPEKEVKATTEKEPDNTEPDMGTVVLPARAAGHRIFVDGRRVQADGNGPLRLRCGTHTIQIGSSGTPESIELPCRGEVQLQ
jgi:hypothetical protein